MIYQHDVVCIEVCMNWIDASIPALVASSLPLPPNELKDNPVVQDTLRVWAPTLQEWQGLGIECFRDLFIDNSFVSFEELSERFKLPKTHFFRYLQIKHFLHC